MPTRDSNKTPLNRIGRRKEIICLVVGLKFFFPRYATARRPNESLSLRLQMAEVRQRHHQKHRAWSQAGDAEGTVGCVKSTETGARGAESNRSTGARGAGSTLCAHCSHGRGGTRSGGAGSSGRRQPDPGLSSGRERNTTTCRDIPSDMLIDLTSDNTGVCTTESSFGKSEQRPSNGLVNVRNIPSTAAANILMLGDISSGCLRDSSDNLMTNSTAHCFMGVSHENVFTLPLVPGNVMTGTCNCNCNFNMNMFLKNVEKFCIKSFDWERDDLLLGVGGDREQIEGGRGQV
jgi:hypothetical protein